MKLHRFFIPLLVLAMLADTTRAAEPAASVKQYSFELVTLNLAHRERRRQSGATLQIDLPSAMTDEELESVKSTLDGLNASPPDSAGHRDFSMSNGTRVRIGGFMEDPEVSGAGVQRLPVEFSVNGEFSAVEAALVLRLATTANLFVAHPDDPTLVATTYQVSDRPFRKEHPRASVTADAESLAEWIRQNIVPKP
jgi:hypothetical protein